MPVGPIFTDMVDPRPGDSGLECLVLVLGFHQISADTSQLRHALGHGDAASAADLVRLAKQLGARSKLTRRAVTAARRLPFPYIVRTTQGRFLVVAAAKDDGFLVQGASGPPLRMSTDQLGELWSGEVVLMTTRAEFQGSLKFDTGWFVPALMKYRGLLGEVLLASFVLQLFALATPMIFQVVIDKVLVHRSLTTLDVLAVGLVVVIVFDTTLGGLRAYLFTHTTSRVDVELGARLYRHLLNLPLAYFEARRVGDSVARVRELDTVPRQHRWHRFEVVN